MTGYRSSRKQHRILVTMLSVMFVLALVPIRYLTWVTSIHNVVEALVTPAAAVGTRITNPLRRRVMADANPASRESLELARDNALLDLARAIDDLNRLELRVESLQQGLTINERPIHVIAAQVTHRPSDLTSRLLGIRAGTTAGVYRQTVATEKGVRLVGRVVQVTAQQSWVLPITDKASGIIRGSVVFPNGATVLCDLTPTKVGTLRGKLWDLPQDIEPPTGGELVRLDDPEWPAHARMLEIGNITHVEVDPESALRWIITVKPRIDLGLVQEVILRIDPTNNTEMPSRTGNGDGT